MFATPDPASAVPRSRQHADEAPAAPRRHEWLAAMLDEVDYGMLLVGFDGAVVHANHAALKLLDAPEPVAAPRLDGRLAVREAGGLRAAVRSACGGLRRLVFLGERAGAAVAAAVPIDSAGEAGVALLVLGKPRPCDELAVQCYALAHHLTRTETQVLQRLVDGAKPVQIAQLHGVSITTVRTQISMIRAKAGAPSIEALVRSVAALPPMLPATGRPARTQSARSPARDPQA